MAQTAAPSKSQLRAARALADAGFDLFEAGDYQQAFERFKSAEEIYHAPPHVLFMGQSAAKLGRLVQARELLKSLVDEELDKSAPKPFVSAKEQAAAELEAVEARLPSLRVTVSGTAGPSTIVIDGRDRSKEAAAGPLSLDPGEHRVQASADGYSPADKTVQLTEGAHETLSIPLQAQAPEQGPLWPAIALAGVGAAGITVGAVMGGLALQKAGDLHDACPIREQCAPEFAPLEEDARLFGNVSTGMFIGGGIFAAGSVLLFIFRPTIFPPIDSSADSSASEEVTLYPLLGPGYVGVTGTF